MEDTRFKCIWPREWSYK